MLFLQPSEEKLQERRTILLRNPWAFQRLSPGDQSNLLPGSCFTKPSEFIELKAIGSAHQARRRPIRLASMNDMMAVCSISWSSSARFRSTKRLKGHLIDALPRYASQIRIAAKSTLQTFATSSTGSRFWRQDTAKKLLHNAAKSQIKSQQPLRVLTPTRSLL